MFGVQQTLLNTDRWVAVVGPLASDPAVQSSVAETTAAVTLNALDVPSRTQSLPGPLRNIASPIQSTLSTFVDEQTQQLVASPQFALLWVTANRAIHEALCCATRRSGAGKGSTWHVGRPRPTGSVRSPATVGAQEMCMPGPVAHPFAQGVQVWFSVSLA
jgi:hypothetical protein